MGVWGSLGFGLGFEGTEVAGEGWVQEGKGRCGRRSDELMCREVCFCGLWLCGERW